MKIKYWISAVLIILISIVPIKKAYKYIKERQKPVIRIKVANHLPGHGPFLPIIDSLKTRYRVEYNNENYDVVVDSVYPNGEIESVKDSKAIKIYYTPEATLPNLEDYDLVIGFNRLDKPNYIRIPYYYGIFEGKIVFEKNMRAKINGKCQPQNKETFACFLVSNGSKTNPHIGGNNLPFDGVAARDKIFNQLSSYKRVESGGKHLNNIGRVIPGEETNAWLSRCKFVIAYENQSYDGYITEKVFQAYFAGSIPIYYSHPNALDDINKKAIIYAGDFANNDDLIEYIKKVDNDDQLYCDIWNQNILTDPNRDYKIITDKLRQKLFKILEEKLPKRD